MPFEAYDEDDLEDAEESGYENGYEKGAEDGRLEMRLEMEQKDDVETITKALAAAGYHFVARQIREWSRFSRHVRSFTPPSFRRK